MNATYVCFKCHLAWREFGLEDEYRDDATLYPLTSFELCPRCYGPLEITNDGSEPSGLPPGGGPHDYR